MHRTLCLFAAIFSPIASPAVYYVDSSAGSDSQNGLTAATPWSTLARAAQAPLSPGDYLLLKRGSTWREALTLNASGAPDLPITVGAYGAGSVDPAIDGSNWSRAADLVSFEGRTDIVLDGIQLRSGQINGLNINNCARITIRNFTVSANRRFGMLIYNCSAVVIENSEISGNGIDVTDSYDGIRIDGSGGELSDFVIRNCNIHNNIGGLGWNSSNGIFLGHTGGTRPILRGVLISGNELAFNGNTSSNQTGRGLTGTFTGDVTVFNNYIHDTSSAGVYLGDEGVNVDITIAQNIFYNNALRQFGGFTTSHGRAFHNAVFVDNGNLTAMGAEVGGSGTWQILNNVFYYQTTSTDPFRGFIRINDAVQDKNLKSDCNLFYSPNPDRWKMSDGITLSFPQWMSLGFDLNSKNPY